MDDIQPKMMKVRARSSHGQRSALHLQDRTQRVHGRGMNKAWKDGSGAFSISNVRTADACTTRRKNFRHRAIEENRRWPGLHRSAFDSKAHLGGDFKHDGFEESVGHHDPLNIYYMGCVDWARNWIAAHRLKNIVCRRASSSANGLSHFPARHRRD